MARTDVLRKELGGQFEVRYEEVAPGVHAAAQLAARHKVAMARDGSGNVEYVGLAAIGAAKSAAAWQIRKLVYTGDEIDDILWAEGDTDFDHIWDDRAGLSYS
jgi:hypothetical protein